LLGHVNLIRGCFVLLAGRVYLGHNYVVCMDARNRKHAEMVYNLNRYCEKSYKG